MLFYILKRVALMIPTLIGVMLITFTVTQFVPGGPVERMVAEMEGLGKGEKLEETPRSIGGRRS